VIWIKLSIGKSEISKEKNGFVSLGKCTRRRTNRGGEGISENVDSERDRKKEAMRPVKIQEGEVDRMISRTSSYREGRTKIPVLFL
jgi:hypothetical protein